MISLTLDTKKCMSALLLGTSFDSFLFLEGEITTFGKFTMNGYLQKDFFEEPPAQEYAFWKDFREFCFSIIRGKRTPLGFRLIFSLAPQDLPEFLSKKNLDFKPEEIQGLYLNFRYNGTTLSCTSGVSTHQFTMDRSLEHAWDKEVQELFADLGIGFEHI